ncbi:hypothetical protein LPN04_29970 [Rugamonas sp. A1-17]|nr:hypothetical protein [Rugamonas sp. A1-17]
MNYANKIAEYAMLLDDKHWLRLLVLLSPGVLAMKVAMTLSAPAPVRLGATALLGVGMAAYVLWDFLKAKIRSLNDEDGSEVEEDEIVPSTQAETPSRKHLDLMTRLVALCDGDATAALTLVADECELHADLSYLTAIENAYRRKEMLVRRLSGS